MIYKNLILDRHGLGIEGVDKLKQSQAKHYAIRRLEDLHPFVVEGLV
jgi:hypothetical protein